MAFSGFTEGGTELPALRDDFNRADSPTPGLSWNEPLFSGVGTLQILSNQLTIQEVAGGGIYWGSDEASADLAVSYTISVLDTVSVNSQISLFLRMPSAELPLDGSGAGEDYYRVSAQQTDPNSSIFVYEAIDGVQGSALTPTTGSQTISGAFAANDKIGVTIKEDGGGNTIIETWWWNADGANTWTKVGSYTRNTAGRRTAAGRTGIELFDANLAGQATIDDFRIDTYSTGVAPQTLLPSADSVDGTWTDNAAGTALAAAIDEASFSDADYIQSVDSPSAAGCRVKLQAGTDPSVSTGHVIHWRIRKNVAGQTVNMTVKLYQGGGNSIGAGTLIATRDRNNVGTSFTTFDETLTGTEADTITDYADLYLEFYATAS